MKSSRKPPVNDLRERSPVCWCGNNELKPFSDDYLRCAQCETLVLRHMPTEDVTRVRDDSADLYGRNYYLKHLQQDFGYPDLKTRARTDLPERCLHWLRTTLKYKVPPGKVLELGSAHGAFVALLRWTGFDATGLELSPWVVKFAKGVFDVPMLTGPVEDQNLTPHSLDVIALMDVLEHIPSPLATMKRCAGLLKEDGALVIQTPRFPEASSYEEMVARGDPFLEQLKASDHLYLYSQKSVQELLRRLGIGHVTFEPAIFAHYDMFLVASRAPLSITSPEQIEIILGTTPASRLIQALLDTDDRSRNLQERLRVADADRAGQLDNIQRLEQLLGESERDRAARLAIIQTQGAQAADLQMRLTELLQRLEASEADRAARLGVIQTQGAQAAELHARLSTLQQQLETSEADRSARLESIQRLEQLLGESERDRAARLGVIQTQGAQVADLQVRLTVLQQQLETLAANRVALGEEINKQRRRLEEADFKHQRLQAEINYSKAHAAEMQTTLQQLGNSPTYRVMRGLGLWRSIAAGAGADPTKPNPGDDGKQKILRRVVVDLTPVLPGADNGGAKLLALELVRQLAQLAGSCEWILLTSEKGHADLASLDSPNVRRVCLKPKAVRPLGRDWSLSRLGRSAGSSSHRNLLRQLNADVIFCPFTTAQLFDSQIPLVSIVYDLQYLAYPEFFSGTERGHRDREFRNVCRLASRLVCISDHVRTAVLEHAPSLDPARVTTIHISLFHRLANSGGVNDAEVLSRLGLSPGRFLLYPANYWRHKNHEMLLTAFGMYRARHPESDLKLVCTGGLSARRNELQAAGARMGMNGELVLTEYLPNEEFAVLLRACQAMIFPSLFEGFGMPVLEAMAADKPVLCSNLTSLPEVVGDAAVLFDPRKPVEIVQAIEQVEAHPELVAQLIQRGRNRLAAFDDTTGMARRYLHVLQDALDGGHHFAPSLHGVFADGWTGDQVTVMYNSNGTQRYLEMILYAPPWLPSETLSVRAGTQTHVIKRDQTITLRHRLPATEGVLEIQIHPPFQPQAKGIGTDTRILGCLCRSCRILSPDETVELFAETLPV